MSWHGRVAELLYDGESVSETVEMGDSSVVVTSHRVLAFTPNAGGANFTEVQRPNVAGVSTGAQAHTDLLERAGRIGVAGVVLLGAGWLLDFGAMLGGVSLTMDQQATGQLGIGSVLGPLQTMLDLLRDLDYYLLLGGAFALLLAVVLLGVYWWQRDRTLVIEVAGGDDVHLPRPENASEVVSRLERAMAPAPSGEAGAGSGANGGLVDDFGTDRTGGSDPLAADSGAELLDEQGDTNSPDDPFREA